MYGSQNIYRWPLLNYSIIDLEALRIVKFQSQTGQPNNCQLWQDDNNQVYTWLKERVILPFQILVLNNGRKALQGRVKVWLKSSKTLTLSSGIKGFQLFTSIALVL